MNIQQKLKSLIGKTNIHIYCLAPNEWIKDCDVIDVDDTTVVFRFQAENKNQSYIIERHIKLVSVGAVDVEMNKLSKSLSDLENIKENLTKGYNQ